MRRLIVLLVILTVVLPVAAQSKLKEMNAQETSALQKRWKESAATIKSIDCDFVQTKHMAVFKKDIRSKGHFQFRRENKIRMEYTNANGKPAYETIMNGNKLKVVSGGKSNILDLGSNQMVAEMGKSLTACMTGDITKINTAYKLTYFSNNKEYMIRIVPKAEEQREYIRELQITLSRSNLSVTSLTIDESDSNTTVYRFTNVKYNTITCDAKFAM